MRSSGATKHMNGGGGGGRASASLLLYLINVEKLVSERGEARRRMYSFAGEGSRKGEPRKATGLTACNSGLAGVIHEG